MKALKFSSRNGYYMANRITHVPRKLSYTSDDNYVLSDVNIIF